MSLCTIFALNLRHAFNNYGILDNMLHMEVLPNPILQVEGAVPGVQITMGVQISIITSI
jgi:hypothetical protein